MKMKLTNTDCDNLARLTASKIRGSISMDAGSPIPAYAVPRGGIPAAYLIAKYISITLVDDPKDARIFIDDLIDSGATRADLTTQYDKPFFSLIDKDRHANYRRKWLIFPWEGSVEGSAEDIGLRLLQFIGEDVNREGLKDTPKRFLKAWKKWTEGYDQDPEEILKVDFKDGAEKYDEMVLVKDIPIYSNCEHHLAAILGVAHIAYIPNGRIVGLSKLARLADCFARRLQVQERLTSQIANSIWKHLNPVGVAVVITARHLCMESRGVEKPGSETTTSAMLGCFKDSTAARNEFLALIK